MNKRSLDKDSLNTRRDWLGEASLGMSGIAIALLSHRELASGAHVDTDSVQSDSRLHHLAKAKRVVQFFMSGAASPCDTFDFKPKLISDHGKDWDPGEKVELFQSTPGKTLRSPWNWQQYGECGKWMNDCVAPLGQCVDEMAFIHNMVSKSNVHGPATFMQSTGFILPGFPSMGSWISYGLGSMNDNLPTFVVLPDPRGFAPNGPKNWGAAFLPAEHQGTLIQPNSDTPIADLTPSKNSFVTESMDKRTGEILMRLNEIHARDRENDSRLLARIRSYELAAKMQLSAPDALRIDDEPQYIRDLYGIDVPNTPSEGPMNEGEETRLFGRNCLVARRLLEKGVRCVQIWSGADNGFPRRNWDSHEDLKRDHWPLGRGMARGAAALIMDLKQRGLLEDTLIHWTTEFGRMPCSQGTLGRDHNPFVFTNWLAGGGIRGGTDFGPSDQWCYKPADPSNPTYCYDIHATMLHLLGIDHERLTFRNNGIDRRLTDVHGHLLKEIIS